MQRMRQMKMSEEQANFVNVPSMWVMTGMKASIAIIIEPDDRAGWGDGNILIILYKGHLSYAPGVRIGQATC